MSEQVGIAVIGCGYWGLNYIRVFSELSQTRVIAVCDQVDRRLNAVKERFPKHFPEMVATKDVEETLQIDGVEAVAVSTNATSHFDIASRAIQQGKHVLVEKPMTTSVVEAEQLVALAETQGVKLMVGHVFLYNPGIIKVKSYIERKGAGDIYYLYARRTNLGPIRRDVSALWDLATHDVAIFNYLLESTPHRVNAVGGRLLLHDYDDVCFVVLSYPNGELGHIHVSWADPHKEREVVVVSSKRRIAFNDLDPQHMVQVFEKGFTSSATNHASFGEYHLSMRDGDIISPHFKISEPLKNQVSHFAECILRDQTPLSDGRTGLEVVRVMEAADISAKNSGRPVNLAEASLELAEEGAI